MPRVLVTDASERAALAVIRSLGRKGIEVTAGDSTSFNAGFLSKHCKERVLYPAPELKKTKFVRALLKLVKNESFDLLIPITDFSMIPIVEHIEDFLQHTKVAAPNYDQAKMALDKAKTIEIALEHGITCPRTLFFEEFGDIKKMSKEITYPAVIKPRMKVFWFGEKAWALKVTPNNYAYNPKDLIKKWTLLTRKLKKVGVKDDFFLVQDFIKGAGFGVEVLMWNFKPKAVFAHKRLREYPITGGASTFRESVADKKLIQLGIRLLQAMKWEGVAMVEFKVNKRTGEPILMEVNGRFWGSLALAINAGVDFPFLLYQLLVEGKDFVCPGYSLGVKQRWLLPGDLLWLYSSLLNRHEIMSSIKQFVGSFCAQDDVIMLSDLAPFFGDLKNSLNFLIDVFTGRRNLFGEIIW